MQLSFQGRVVPGEGMARRLGCPTANIAVEQGVIIPALGVYVGETEVDGRRYGSLICINDGRTGYNLKMEVHLLGQDIELNGKRIKVKLVDKLRDLIPYPGESEMAEIVQQDIVRATDWMNGLKAQESAV
jgi:riboflavin kinase / FMN adenylyltransferase